MNKTLKEFKLKNNEISDFSYFIAMYKVVFMNILCFHITKQKIFK